MFLDLSQKKKNNTDRQKEVQAFKLELESWLIYVRVYSATSSGML